MILDHRLSLPTKQKLYDDGQRAASAGWLSGESVSSSSTFQAHILLIIRELVSVQWQFKKVVYWICAHTPFAQNILRRASFNDNGNFRHCLFSFSNQFPHPLRLCFRQLLLRHICLHAQVIKICCSLSLWPVIEGIYFCVSVVLLYMCSHLRTFSIRDVNLLPFLLCVLPLLFMYCSHHFMQASNSLLLYHHFMQAFNTLLLYWLS